MDFPTEFHFFPLPTDSASVDSWRYVEWARAVKPRTCLLLHWLHGIGAVADPGEAVHIKARHFASKRALLGQLVDNSLGQTAGKVSWLLENGEFDLYVAYLMWLRFNEYVPRQFVLPEGRTRVLSWVRSQLRRPELTDAETVSELNWQIDRIQSAWGETSEWEDLRTL